MLRIHHSPYALNKISPNFYSKTNVAILVRREFRLCVKTISISFIKCGDRMAGGVRLCGVVSTKIKITLPESRELSIVIVIVARQLYYLHGIQHVISRRACV